ncbi:MAG: endonuclease/exonuclease/phosphatase family protein [Planctomycetota bacterium]
MPRTGQALRLALFLVGGLILLNMPATFADQFPIVIEGAFADWDEVPVAYSDATGDGGFVDFGRLWLADDPRFMFLRIEFGNEIDDGENNSIHIYLDTDANAQTGLSIAGIGAELDWRLGSRAGTYYYQGQSRSVDQADLRFRGGPTITSTQFEFAFGRDTLPDGTHPLFLGPEVKIVIRDTAGGDQLPETGEVVSYTLDLGDLPPETVIPLEREHPSDLRFITYNVENDSPWSSGQEPRFGRQLAAVAPDIISFQEIYNHTPSQVAALVAAWVPLEAGQSWYAADVNDCPVVSRYPILDTWALDGNIAALLDTTSIWNTPLLLINAHLPCCDNDSGRQNEIDRIMGFIRDAREPGGVLQLDENTPIVITGDMNLVGLAQQVTTLLTGDIVNEGTYGPDFDPDWDGSPLTRLIFRQTEKRMGYTWRNDGSSYWPGHLDYVVYTDAILTAGNHFILYTPEMSPDRLSTYGLESSDSEASDHLLTCADFRPPPTHSTGDMNCDGQINAYDIDPFICALSPGCDYEGTYPDCDRLLADTNNDGDINAYDIDGFIALVGGG